jgi:hypothetical protein
VGSLQPIAGALSAAGTKNCTPILVAKPCFEEPYALIALVRICGGDGRVTFCLYPEKKGAGRVAGGVGIWVLGCPGE